MICPMCDGTGNYGNNDGCPHCDGTGKIPDTETINELVTVKCHKCGEPALYQDGVVHCNCKKNVIKPEFSCIYCGKETSAGINVCPICFVYVSKKNK